MRHIYANCSRAERRLLLSVTWKTVMGFRVAPMVVSRLSLMAALGGRVPFPVRLVTLEKLFAGVNFGLNMYLDTQINRIQVEA